MHQTDADELLEMFITSILTSYDPHTSYMSPKSVENFRILMRLNLEGIGAALQMVDGYTVISKIIPGGAADKQGKLKPEDRIVSVSNDKGEMVDVVDMKLNDVVDMIRGKAGTVVKLGVLPAGSNEMKVHSITRAKIELKDSEARAEIITEGTKADGSPLQIGVIDLPSFYMDMEGRGTETTATRAPRAMCGKSWTTFRPKAWTWSSSTSAATAVAVSPKRSA